MVLDIARNCRVLLDGEHRFGLAVVVVTLLLPSASQAQVPRVQFIHASPYAESAQIDVYRNGELWLDDFAFTDGTPFTDWSAGFEHLLDFTSSSDPDNSNPFFSGSLRLEEGDKYYVVAAGDPMRRADQPVFQLLIQSGALESSPFEGDFEGWPALEGISVSPDQPRYGRYWRGGNPETFQGRLDTVYPESVRYGEFTGYIPAPTVIMDGDAFAELGDVVLPPYPFNLVDETLRKRHGDVKGSMFVSVIMDMTNKGLQSFIMVSSGFVHPPSPGDAQYVQFFVLSDGTTERNVRNTAHLQWINNSPYVEAELVDVYINGIRVVDDLGFRQATPYMEFPAGLQHFSAPTLSVDITAADATDNGTPLFSREITLLFGEKYVATVVGDPLAREGQREGNLSVYEGWHERAVDSTRVDLLFSHGIPDIFTTTIGIEGDPLPLTGLMRFGEFATSLSLPVDDDTLYVTRADTRDLVARVEPQLLTRDLRGASLVVLTSGFIEPPEGIASEDSDLALVAALPSGGELLRFEMTPPPSWWQNPWLYVIGLLVLGAVAISGNQVRILRLRTRERELSVLVAERTRELVSEKRKTEEQARRLVELDEAKNRLFANISHEFRTPLTLLISPLKHVLDGGGNQEDLTRSAPLMLRNARRILRLINQLLDLTKLGEGKTTLHLEEGNLTSFLHDLVMSFAPLADRKRITLRFSSSNGGKDDSGDGDVMTGAFDPDAVEKIVANLLSNALKFTREGGDVWLSLTVANDGKAVEIAVRDTGIGIPKEATPRLFDRFHQVDSSSTRGHEGTGIGLALVKELVNLYGGSIRVESEPDIGSTFTILLPIDVFIQTDDELIDDVIENYQSPTAALEIAVLEASGSVEETIGVVTEPASDEAPHSEVTVLIADDNADVRAFVRGHLQSHYRIIEAVDGEVGLEQARKHTPDLIISDVMMPRLNGFGLCRAVKGDDRLCDIPVILLTAKAAEEDRLYGLEGGADDYITKPFSVRELEVRVANLILSRRELRTRFSKELRLEPFGVVVRSEDEEFLEQVLNVMNRRLGDSNFGTDMLSDEMGLSRRTVERRMKAVTRTTAPEFMRRLRLERAAQILTVRPGSISEVAYTVGFKSPSHFTVAFRKAYGRTPSEHIESSN